MGLLKKIGIILASLIIVAVVFSSFFRQLTPFVKQYKSQVESHLTQILGQKVTIQTMQTGWYWFHPVLKLKEVKISDEKKSISIGSFLIGIDLLKSLWGWNIQPSLLYLEDLHLVLRQTASQWQVDGMRTRSLKNEISPKQIQDILAWLTQRNHLVVKKASISLYLHNGTLIPLSGINISLVNNGGFYKIKGEAKLSKSKPTLFQLLGNIDFNINQIQKSQGQFYARAKNITIAPWLNFLPSMKETFEGGKGDIALWMDINKGKISWIQARGQLKNLTLKADKTKNNNPVIQYASANLSWSPNNKGWELQSDHIKLKIDDLLWPENKLSLKFNKTVQGYQLFVKSILIKSFLSSNVHWPEFLQNIVQLKPSGLLDNTQLFIKEGKPYYFLTRFYKLGWVAKNGLPEVRNISGVINWQPEEGHLELDSEHVVVNAKGYPAQNLTLINGAFDWKELSHGLRVSIERFVASKPDLTLTAEGVLDEVTSNSVENIGLVLEFSGSNLQQYVSFLPKEMMKVKLYNWLTQDLKKITQASGKMVVKGVARDFPFAKGQGEFSINSHISGGELQVNSQWPLIKDIEAYLRVRNPDLDVDIVNADIQGVPLKQMNLGIANIGLNKETLLIHSLIHGDAQKMKDYILASPLKEKLTILKILSLEGLALLNLNLEIPLYPNNDSNLVKGELTFKNNTINVNHLFKIPLQEVSGEVFFNEQGVSKGTLQAESFGSLVDIKIQPSNKEISGRDVLVKGQWSVDSLKKQFNLPLFSLIQGLVPLNISIVLSKETQDIAYVHFKSSLKGLTINLPAPLGKKADTLAPANLDLDFKSRDSFSLGAHYKDLVLKAKLLSNKRWSFLVDQKNISADLIYDKSTNNLSGSIKHLHLNQFSKDEEWSSSISPEQIPNLNLHINQLFWGAIEIGDLTFKSHSTKEKWSLDYCRIEAPAYQFNVDGNWTQSNKKNETKIGVRLYLKSLAKSLEQWQIIPAVDADKGLVEFQGGWKGAVYDFSLASLNGSLAIQLNHGRITHLSPETEEKLGLGKLLSILSLQTIPRRLQLDFSDLSHGYSFDIFKGSFSIKQGIMNTQDSYIDGPVAYASMKGDLDLVKRVYDLNLSISPHITASLPLVATIAGGPLAGLAVWVANNIINQSMQKISAYTYKVSGPWKDPVIQQLTIVRKIIKNEEL